MQQQMTEEQKRELEEKLKNKSPEELKEFKKQQCIFCQIIAGKIPSKKVYEDGKCIAVMDINPAAIGHVLLLPKEHYAVMPQVPEEEIGHMFMVAKHLSQAMLRRLRVGGTNIFVANGLVAGQNAQHFMIHIIPRKEGDGILEIPEYSVDKNVRKQIRETIGKKANELFGIKEKAPVEEPEEEAPKLPKEGLEEKSPQREEPEEKEPETPAQPEEEKEEVLEKEAPKEEEKNEEEKDEKETDLDDIAGLFK